MAVRGFIIHPTYRIEAGRPVIHLFGRLETGESFLVRDSRPHPYFFIRTADRERVETGKGARIVPVDLLSMRGEPVLRVEVPSPPDTTPLRDALHREGVLTFEADIRYAIRYLIDGGLRGSITIEEEGVPGAAPGGKGPGAAVSRIFENATLRPGDWRPAPSDLRIVSLDIETDPTGRVVYAVALAGAGIDEVHLAADEERVREALKDSPLRERVRAWGDERRLLQATFERLRQVDFDILTGWNVIDFDLSVLAAAARRLGVPFEVGRLAGAVRVNQDSSFWGRSRAEIAGRVVLDGINLIRGAFVKLQDYRLNTAARELLGEGKVSLDAGAGPERGRAEAIERAYRQDLLRFVEYNRADAHLVLRILEKARLIELVVERCLLTGMPPDRVGGSIASFDFLYLHELRRRGRVAPSLTSGSGDPESTAGGAVLEPAPGLYDNVMVFDFKSLYPSLIRTFNIDPLGHLAASASGGGEDSIRAPNGALVRREPGILPEMLRELFPRREAAKRAGDAITAHALKILMNSFYGVLATPVCRFHSGPVANAITHFGRWILHWTRDRMESIGYRVLYGDTDSLFVLSGLSGEGERSEAQKLGADLCRRINEELASTVRSEWGVVSHLDLEFEVLFLKLWLPALRGGGAGARKRYVGLVDGGGSGDDELKFVGMEVVRRDWTDMSKIFQRGLFERLFRGTTAESVSVYLRGFVRDLKEGRHDDHLVYRKALRKNLSDYTATTPPHVKAARLLGARVRGVIEYVMTTGGPEPIAIPHGPIDYEHYVEKQIRPIVEQVLPHLGIDFATALGNPTQGQLF